MKASTLNNRIAKSNNKNGSAPKNESYQNALKVLRGDTVHYNYYTGSGRHTKIVGHSPIGFLKLWGIDFETGNDAPRGGQTGDFIRLTKKGKTQVKEYIKEQQELRLIATQAAAEAKEKRNNEIKTFLDSLPANDAFENKWNNTELKEQSKMGWKTYRNTLKQQFPKEWSILKQKFIAQRSL